MKKYISIALFIFLICCHPIFCKWELGYTQLESQPDEKQTIGLYKLSEESKEYLGSDLKGWTSTLELNKNGKLIYKNGDKIIKIKTWQVICGESYDCVIDMEERVVPFTEKNGKYAIMIAIGDGDECNGIVYEKTK
ncbi:hypothetical protein [Winogradskyella thalassocola]|uniref:Uncharacterized protein n=1 Tax=Winogradskyella thalassocola TaxID=262004 RepID=A0A1G8J8B3_9FLAO|nr:hypothetical protein [Winogradskyella thalassocola]SDI27426.1 hypothetical protein SAMN04489796_1095 [Winogradskyella thalassocola]